MRIPQYGTQSTANTLISRAYTYRNRLRLIFFEFTLRVDPIRDPLPSLHSEDLEKIVHFHIFQLGANFDRICGRFRVDRVSKSKQKKGLSLSNFDIENTNFSKCEDNEKKPTQSTYTFEYSSL